MGKREPLVVTGRKRLSSPKDFTIRFFLVLFCVVLLFSRVEFVIPFLFLYLIF